MSVITRLGPPNLGPLYSQALETPDLEKKEKKTGLVAF